MSGLLYASYVVQAAGALLNALIFGSFYRTYRRSFLRHWARAWLCLCLLIALAGASAALSATYPAEHPLRLGIALIGGAMSYLQVALLLFGSFELLAAGSVNYRSRRWGLAAAAVTGLATSLLFAFDPAAAPARFFMRVGLRGLVVALAFFTAALCVYHAREGRRRLGRRLVTAALLGYGVNNLLVLWVGIAQLVSQTRYEYALYLGFVDFVVSVGIGLSVVIWLLEEEREAVRDFAEQVERLAYRDALTGLPNRQLFLDHLDLAIAQARRDRHQVAVFFLDLDRFKVINDSLGHAVGDRLLQQVAQRIRATLRGMDTVARMGGDEFTVIAPVIHSAEDAVAVARKVQEAIRQPVRIDGRELFVAASLGISIYPDDGEVGDVLLKHADTAMYRAKAQGAELFQLYTPEMNAAAVEQLALENALRRAGTTGEFDLYFQPIVDMRENRVGAVEAMLRWRHPDLGVLRPNQFLGLAETTGLIVQMGEWSFREGCRQLAGWRVEHPHLRLAVNVSKRQLKQPDFVAFVLGVLAEHALPPSSLELEISESNAAQCDDQAVERLRELRARGVRVSIDDFGTGYSSLGRLRGFPVDALKIDTSFVRDLATNPRDARIAAAVIALAHALKLSVVAEGVENPTQLQFLRQQGCELWQGYLCCPPVAAAEATATFSRRLGSEQLKLLTPADAVGVLG